MITGQFIALSLIEDGLPNNANSILPEATEVTRY
jgi:hypothetical protein